MANIRTYSKSAQRKEHDYFDNNNLAMAAIHQCFKDKDRQINREIDRMVGIFFLKLGRLKNRDGEKKKGEITNLFSVER